MKYVTDHIARLSVGGPWSIGIFGLTYFFSAIRLIDDPFSTPWLFNPDTGPTPHWLLRSITFLYLAAGVCSLLTISAICLRKRSYFFFLGFVGLVALAEILMRKAPGAALALFLLWEALVKKDIDDIVFPCQVRSFASQAVLAPLGSLFIRSGYV